MSFHPFLEFLNAQEKKIENVLTLTSMSALPHSMTAFGPLLQHLQNPAALAV